MSKIVCEPSDRFNKSFKLQNKGISFEDMGFVPNVDIDVNETIYNNLKKSAQKNPDSICINHNDRRITYSEFLNLVDKIAAYLKSKNICEGDIISLPINNSIEQAALLFAINKVGAISKWQDTDKSSEELLEEINDTYNKMVFADSSVKEKIESIKDNLNTKDIIYLNSKEDTDSFIDVLNSNSYNDFECINYDKNRPSVMITSSGSTGLPKKMFHSDYSINNAIKKLIYAEYPIKGNCVTVIVPPYIGLGLVTTTCYALLCEGKIEILDEYKNPFILAEYLIKNNDSFKYNTESSQLLLFGAPMYFKAMGMLIDQIRDLSFVGAIVAAGSKMDEQILLDLDEKFKSKGCSVPVCNAYGQNEHCGGITYNTVRNNKRGSAGKVAYGTRVMVVDADTKEEKKPNEIGKIIEQSESQFLGYFKNEEATKNSEFYDADGELWFDTKDLGCFDDENYLHILDRESRSITRFDNKVALAKIEKKLLSDELIKDAIVVKVNAVGPIGMDEAPFAFIVLNDNSKYLTYDELIGRMQSGNYPFTMLEIPVLSEVINEDSIPYKNGKIDYKKLEKVAQNIVDNYNNINVLESGNQKLLK